MVDPGHKAYRSQPCRFFAFGRGICRNEDCRFGHFDEYGNGMRLAENITRNLKYLKTGRNEAEEDAPVKEEDYEIWECEVEGVWEEGVKQEDFEEKGVRRRRRERENGRPVL